MNRDISKQGYKRSSPYVNRPYLLIDSPNGVITMNNVDKTIIAKDLKNNETRILEPNSGNHVFKGDKILEIPVENFNNLNNSKMIQGPTNKKLFNQAFMRAKLKMGGYAMPEEIIKQTMADYAKKGGGFTLDVEKVDYGKSPDFIKKMQKGGQGELPPIEENPLYQRWFVDKGNPEENYAQTKRFNQYRPVNTKYADTNAQNAQYNQMVDFNNLNKAASALYLASNENDPMGAPRGISWDQYNKYFKRGNDQLPQVGDGRNQNDAAQQIINKKGQNGGIIKAQVGIDIPPQPVTQPLKTYTMGQGQPSPQWPDKPSDYEIQESIIKEWKSGEGAKAYNKRQDDLKAWQYAPKWTLDGKRTPEWATPENIKAVSNIKKSMEPITYGHPDFVDERKGRIEVRSAGNRNSYQEGGSVKGESFDQWVQSTLGDEESFKNLPNSVKQELSYFKEDPEAKSNLTESYVQKYAPDVYNYWKNSQMRDETDEEVSPEDSMLDEPSSNNFDVNLMANEVPLAQRGGTFSDYINREKIKQTMNVNPNNFRPGSLVTFQRGGKIQQGVIKAYNPETGKITLY